MVRRACLGWLCCAVLLGWASFVGVGTAGACPFCSAPTLTLTEQFGKSEVALLVQFVEAEEAKGTKLGSTRYLIVQTLRLPAATEAKLLADYKKKFAKGETVTLPRQFGGKKGNLCLLFGSEVQDEKVTSIDWAAPMEVTETIVNYMVQAPPLDTPAEKRLAYFLKFLEFSDQALANDAYSEFANANYKDIVALAPLMPRDKLRKWLVSPDVPTTRLGLYGLMLGLCGDDNDARVMEKKILDDTEEYRLGVDGIMGGYLLLTGEKGLSVIEKSKFLNKKAPFSETYAGMQAVRFMWTYAAGRIEKDRLKSSMRLLLERTELADLVINDLARWKDWSIQDKLMQVYGTDGYDIPSIKRAIVRYMLASVKDAPADNKSAPPPHVVNGKKHLDKLRQIDPKIVADTEQFYSL